MTTPQEVADVLERAAGDLADAVTKYDAAIKSCADDPDRMASFCTAQGDDLDALYWDMLGKSEVVAALRAAAQQAREGVS